MTKLFGLDKALRMQCPVCHHPQTFFPENIYSYGTHHPLFLKCQRAHCQRCASGWVVNPPSENDLKVYYDEGAYGGGSILARWQRPNLSLERNQSLARWQFILEAMSRQAEGANGEETLCDIGAGYGCTFEVAKHLNLPIRYFAYESSVNMRRHILSLGGEVAQDFLDHPHNQKYDIVWASHILEHYPDPDILLKKIRSLLKPSGFGFIEVPCLDFEFKPNMDPHLLFFSPEGLEHTLRRNHFHILRCETVGMLRKEAAQKYQTLHVGKSFRDRVKARLPKSVVSLLRIPYNLALLFKMRKQITVAADLQNEALFKEWGLKNYGGERCWIRAVFAPEG